MPNDAAYTAAGDYRPVISEELRFGPFRFSPVCQALFEGDRPVRLGSRALDILTVLVARAGDVVGKNELIAAAWPNTFVDEINLRVHVVALRKALGDGRRDCRYIRTVAGRGYRFVAAVSVAGQPVPPQSQPRPAQGRSLPFPVTPVFGRSDAIRLVGEEIALRRMVTLIGPAGVGKTTVAIAAACEAIETFGDNIGFVDLAAIADPGSLATAVSCVIGTVHEFEIVAAAGVSPVGRRSLLVLDNCERALDVVAPMAEDLLRRVPGLSILATSRERLRADGERVHRLAPLLLPPANVALSAAEALTFPAVQLFVEVVTASEVGFRLSDRDAPAVAAICRRLDGLPLAIELAAGRVHALGLANMLTALDDRIALLGSGRRTASPRHRTFCAALDWTWDLLSEAERMALFRLIPFAASFDLDEAVVAAACDGVDPADSVANIESLVAKSLLVAEPRGPRVRYRLLWTTRAYVRERLSRSGSRAPLPHWNADDHQRLGVDALKGTTRHVREDHIAIRVIAGELRPN